LSNTAGIGDPYWYEWSVGLLFIVHMLNPDNGIKNVTFQSTEITGLDDVVVEYSNGKKRYIQVKHTRGSDTITFGDLVTPEESKSGKNKPSLLKYLSSGWKKARTEGEHIDVVLFTNRETGKKPSTTRSGNKIFRPPLNQFYEWLQKKVVLHK